MSALQFLNKKSWHTATIRNNEKVWLKEQEAAKEEARVKELQKQLEEERKLQEIQRLEIESGRLKPEDVQRRRQLSWMYEEGHENKDDEKEKDDVLMGKKKIEIEKLAEQKKKEEKAALIDVDTKIREDPLAQMRRDELNRLKEMSRRTGYTVEELQLKRKALKYTKEEWEEKMKRKEERKRAREEKRKAKEERRAKKRAREERYAKKFGLDVSVPSANPETTPGEDEYERDSLTKTNEFNSVDSERKETDVPQDEQHKYGLRMPLSGTRVAVTTEFVPRTREQIVENPSDDRPRKRRKSRWDCPPEPEKQPQKLSQEEREARLREMQHDAQQLLTKRRESFEKFEKEQLYEDEREDRARRRIADEDGSTGYELPTRRMAREAISNLQISNRIRR